MQRDADTARVRFRRCRETSSPVSVAACLDCDADIRKLLRQGRQHIEDAVHGARAVQHAAGAAQDLDGSCLLEIDLEEFVDVTAADRADRDAVLQHQHGAAGAGARQHRRAQGCQRLLAAAALNHRSGRAIQQIGGMGRARQFECRRDDPCRATRIVGKRNGAPGRSDDDFLERPCGHGQRAKDGRRRELCACSACRNHARDYSGARTAGCRARANIRPT